MLKALKLFGPPGCGKTSTEMKFYRNLLDKGVTVEDITAVTFRLTSAEDLINNVIQKTKSDRKIVKKHVGTIHSICNRLIGYNTLISPKEISDFLKEYRYAPYMKSKKQKFVCSVNPEITDTDEIVQSGDLFDMYTWLMNTQTPIDSWYKYPGSGNISMPENM